MWNYVWQTMVLLAVVVLACVFGKLFFQSHTEIEVTKIRSRKVFIEESEREPRRG